MSRFFLDNNQLTNEGIIIAGSADLKVHLQNKEFFNPQLKVIRQVDVAYGGEAGLNEALNLCSDLFSQLDLMQERQVLQAYFELIAKDSQLIVFGEKQVCSLLEQGLLQRWRRAHRQARHRGR